jgi:release factor glutamine methyltransferase
VSPTDSFRRGQDLVRRNAEAERRPNRFTLFGREWELLDGVFAPVFCYSTQLFAGWLPYPPGGSFLEVGSGTGVAAVMAALRGCAAVTAVDLSAVAVENTRRNVARHGVQDRVRVLRSDLFEALGPGERFDLIFWNSSFIRPPAGYAAGDDLAAAVFDPGYAAHRRFVRAGPRHLGRGGRLLLGFSDLGDASLLDRLARESGLRVEERNSSGSLLPDVTYQLLELVPDPRRGAAG